MLSEVPAAVGHGFGPPAIKCESQAPLDLLEEYLFARPLNEELGILIGELRGGQVDDDVE